MSLYEEAVRLERATGARARTRCCPERGCCFCWAAWGNASAGSARLWSFRRVRATYTSNWRGCC